MSGGGGYLIFIIHEFYGLRKNQRELFHSTENWAMGMEERGRNDRLR